MSLWKHIEKCITEAINKPFILASKKAISGGCINQCFHLAENAQQQFFLKLNTSFYEDMFDAEIDGLNELRKTEMIRIPNVICNGSFGEHSFLVLEFIPLQSSGSQKRLGSSLAQLHAIQQTKHGFRKNNYLATSQQINTPLKNWADFFIEQRLESMFSALSTTNTHFKNTKKLLIQAHAQIQHQPIASLLHGDLWAGNYAFDAEQQPVIFDPAVYYGDRETDIAMTELFSGFDATFYTAYQETWPLEQAYERRKDVYQLYHLLNHCRLFAGSYQQQTQTQIDKIIITD